MLYLFFTIQGLLIFCINNGAVAERLRCVLQSRLHRFESGPHLQKRNVLQIKKLIYYVFKFSGVAQLVEQATVNRWVTGSSPVAGAKKM